MFSKRIRIVSIFVLMMMAFSYLATASAASNEISANTVNQEVSQETSLGIQLHAGVTQRATPMGYHTSVNRNELPAEVRDFVNIEVQSYVSQPSSLSNLTFYAISRYNDTTGYNSGVPMAGTWYPLVILFDKDFNPIAYYLGQLDITQQGGGQTIPSSAPQANNPMSYGSDIDPNYNKTGHSPFMDVDNTYWAYDAIKDLSSRKVIEGYPDGRYRPEKLVSRAEFAKIMVLAARLQVNPVMQTSFADTAPSDWYSPYVEAAKPYLSAFKLPNGQLQYNPDAPALREDIVVAMVKLKGYDSKLPDLSIIQAMFTDYDSISAYARNYVAIAVENGLISGYPDETFRSQEAITRAQAAAIMSRAFRLGNDNKLQQEGNKVDFSEREIKIVIPTAGPTTVTQSTYEHTWK